MRVPGLKWPLILVSGVVGFVLGAVVTFFAMAVLLRIVQEKTQTRVFALQQRARQSVAEPQAPWLPMRLSPSAASWRLLPLDDGGDPVTLGELRDHGVFLQFWATWCLPCLREMPSVQALAHSLPPDRIRFLLVSTESREVIKAFLDRHPLHVPVYLGSAPPPVFSVPVLPATFIIAPGGRIEARYLGSARWDDPRVASFLREMSNSLDRAASR